MRILIIEDEEKLANSLKKTLESEFYVVDIARDGNEGYEMAFDESYDLIILDIGLPGMDGLSIAQEVRKENLLAPILMLTARDTQQNKITGLDAGADDYLVKPFDFEELLARIRALTRKTSFSKQLTYTVDNLFLDSKTKIVKRAGKEIALSAKEYTVLEYLMRHPKQIIAKERLLDHCWDNQLDALSNTVDVHIGYVRSKVDRAFPNEVQLIKTIKGLGYRIG